MNNNTKIKQLNAKTLWWTPKIEGMKCALKKLNRMKYRTKNKYLILILKLIESNLRQLYRKEIRISKNNSWRSFISQDKAWGKPYKIIVKGSSTTSIPLKITNINGDTAVDLDESIKFILEDKYPAVSPHLFQNLNLK